MKNASAVKSVIIYLIAICFISTGSYAQKPTAETFYEIGLQNLENSEYSEASDAFEHAIKLKPKYAEAHFQLGNTYFKLHRYEEALGAYKKAVEYKPKFSDAHLAIGVLSSMMSEYVHQGNQAETKRRQRILQPRQFIHGIGES
jgi:tetratricopeptide (TPR) repeat protein